MKKNIFYILLISLTLNAEEFIYKDTTVKSEKVIKIVNCGSFDIKLETEEFPFKYEGKIPYKFRIKNFYGTDNILSKKIFLMPKNIEIVFPENIKNSVLKNRTFLPYKVTCENKKFMVSYWSGGNCKGCETFIKFDVYKGEIINSTLVK